MVAVYRPPGYGIEAMHRHRGTLFLQAVRWEHVHAEHSEYTRGCVPERGARLHNGARQDPMTPVATEVAGPVVRPGSRSRPCSLSTTCTAHIVLHGRAAWSRVTRVPAPLSRHPGFRHASAISSPPSLAPQHNLSRRRLSSPSLKHAFEHLFEPLDVAKVVLVQLRHVHREHAPRWWFPKESAEGYG